MKYRKRPIVIDAEQWSGAESDWDAMREFCPTGMLNLPENHEPQRLCSMSIPTLEGEHDAQPGDWIIKGIAGEFYPCKPEIFAATYEAVE